MTKSTYNKVFKTPKTSTPKVEFLTMDNIQHATSIPPSNFWLRTNGKTHTYASGKTVDCTLEWCVHNINDAHSTFKLTDRTLPTLAKQASCTVDYLIYATLISKYQHTRFGEFCQQEAVQLTPLPNPKVKTEIEYISEAFIGQVVTPEIIEVLLEQVNNNKKFRDEIRAYIDIVDNK